ncbi:MAG: hypothetical protein AAFV78_07985 [Bacteroidota bacterium]
MNRLSYILIIGLLALMSCEPFVAEKSELGPVPTASFDIIPGSTPNAFTLRNTTEGAFVTQWDMGSAGTAEGEEAQVTIIFKGDYEISMTTFTRGGHATTSQSLTVTQDDPSACGGNLKLLTGCGTKVWKLAPEAEAMHIGPSLTETWWGNSEGDVASRACHFDDEYIFSSDGTFEYDNKGAFWADVDGNQNVTPGDLGLPEGCNDATSWPTKYKVWDSNTHTFNINENQLTVVGEGAWIGLYKIGTTDEVDRPQSSVTYSIQSITETRMVLFADYGWGVWRITLTSN